MICKAQRGYLKPPMKIKKGVPKFHATSSQRRISQKLPSPTHPPPPTPPPHLSTSTVYIYLLPQTLWSANQTKPLFFFFFFNFPSLIFQLQSFRERERERFKSLQLISFSSYDDLSIPYYGTFSLLFFYIWSFLDHIFLRLSFAESIKYPFFNIPFGSKGCIQKWDQIDIGKLV